MSNSSEDFADWCEHVVAPGGRFRVWYLKPATILFTVTVPVLDVPILDAYLRLADEVRRLKESEIAAAGGIASILDWRGADKFPDQSRVYAKEYYKTSVYKGPIRARYMTFKSTPLFRMSYNILNMNVSLLSNRIPIKAVAHPYEAMERLGASPPVPDPEVRALGTMLSERDFVPMRSALGQS